MSESGGLTPGERASAAEARITKLENAVEQMKQTITEIAIKVGLAAAGMAIVGGILVQVAFMYFGKK